MTSTPTPGNGTGKSPIAVVAAAVGGLPAAVGDGGVLVDGHDPATWATALHRLVGDPALRVDDQPYAHDARREALREQVGATSGELAVEACQEREGVGGEDLVEARVHPAADGG